MLNRFIHNLAGPVVPAGRVDNTAGTAGPTKRYAIRVSAAAEKIDSLARHLRGSLVPTCRRLYEKPYARFVFRR